LLHCITQHANANAVFSASCSWFIVDLFLSSSFTALLYLPLPASLLNCAPPDHCSLLDFSPVNGCSFCHSLLHYTVALAMPMPPQLLMVAFHLPTICVGKAVTTRFTAAPSPVLMKIHCQGQLMVDHCS